ncbi:MAG: elongation factor P [Nannocystaceae bacterium]
MDVSELRKNAKLELDGHPYVVTEFQFVKPGKGQGLYKCKLKNMITGSVIDRTYRSGEKLEAANVDTRNMQFLFSGAGAHTFMDSSTYEQVELAEDLVGDDKFFLLDIPQPGTDQPIAYTVLFYNDRPVGLDVPSHLVMEVSECEPGVKGDTATNVTKGATIQTGLEVQVPLFIKQGDMIKIDTRSRSYVERVNVNK